MVDGGVFKVGGLPISELELEETFDHCVRDHFERQLSGIEMKEDKKFRYKVPFSLFRTPTEEWPMVLQ